MCNERRCLQLGTLRQPIASASYVRTTACKWCLQFPCLEPIHCAAADEAQISKGSSNFVEAQNHTAPTTTTTLDQHGARAGVTSQKLRGRNVPRQHMRTSKHTCRYARREHEDPRNNLEHATLRPGPVAMDISTQDTQISTQVSTQERVVKHTTRFRSARIKHESTGCGPDIP